MADCAQDEKEALLKAVCLAAAVDGKLPPTEVSFLREVAYRAELPLDEQSLQELVKKFN